MRQYLEIKGQYPDALLFFRMGDFYELFFDDAVVASEMLDLTLTSRDKNKEDPVPMAGVPHHAVTGYIRKALDRGATIAICDQIEDPRAARGLVKRAVTRVITPGVVLDADHLEARDNNYLVCLVAEELRFGLAALDLSTFDLRATELSGHDEALDELARLRPREVLLDGEMDGERQQQLQELAGGVWHPVPDELRPIAEKGRALVEERGRGSLSDLGLAERPLATAAAALALRYAETTQPASELPFFRIRVYHPADHLQLDETTIRNLELFESMMERRRKGSLLWVLDATQTAMGARLMRQVVGRPLTDVAAIQRRLDAVEILVERAGLRQGLREALKRIHDLERLTSRAVLQVATPRELGRLGRSLEQLPRIAELCAGATTGSNITGEAPEFLRWPDDLLRDVAKDLAETLVEDPPAVTKDGGYICEGHDPALDELIRLCEGGRSDIVAIEARERERTGISSLKVRFNKVFGYFIEVTRSNLKSVPGDYQRKQTLVNAERFTTVELAEYEAKVLGAEERRVVLEQELFERLRKRVAAQVDRLTAAASRVAMLDVLCSLAEVAQRYGYVRPDVDSGPVISIEDGRHPVVERFLPAGEFVPNDVTLDPDEGRLLVLTGPNMSGKSTVMRQVALLTLMTQMGSYVPARTARVGVVDRLFTRVGASDNLARGESTFMVEMRETASILRHATDRSLVVLDEIGRGTATYDGISIAWAVAEYLHDRVKCRAMFATHYHELCALAEVKKFVQNFNIAVQEWKGKVVFLRKLVPGGSSRSYGIEVARLAGLDRWVVNRSRKVLAALEDGDPEGDVPVRARPGAGSGQLGLFDRSSTKAKGKGLSAEEREVLGELRGLDPDTLTPLQALNCLASLVERFSAAKESD
jgi:DNA mismatch repair protein MutS